MANFYRVALSGLLAIAACWLMLQPLRANAQVSGTTSNEYRYRVENPWVSSPLAACQQIGPFYTQARFIRDLNASQSQIECWQGTTWVLQTFLRRSTTTCPANSTLQSGSCVCTPPYQAIGGTCVDPQAAACAALSGQSLYLTFNGAVAPGQSACDATGCSVTVGSPIIRARTPSGGTVSEGEGTFTGSTCTPSPSSPPSEPDTCVNGQAGQVNGVDVCIPYSGSDDVETIDESSKETSEGSNTTQETTSKHTSCTNNSCTTTTTTTTIINGGAPVTRATQETESRDDFCTENPRAQQCKESAFSGSCASGFTCEGDAVQCAQARELYRLSCALQADSPEAALYASNASPNANAADIPSQTVNIGPGAFNASNALGASACLADVAVTVWGAEISLPLSDVCPALDYLRLLLLAVAWLAAFRIVSVG